MELTFTLPSNSSWKDGKFVVDNLQINPADEEDTITFDKVELFLDGNKYNGELETWAGYKMKAENLFESVMNSYLRNDGAYTYGDEWKIFSKIDSAKEEQDGLITKLPTLYFGSLKVYELEYATTRFRFYNNYDEFLMLDTEGRVKTDIEAFYTSGLYQEICAVIKGESKCLYKSEAIDRLIKEEGGEAEFLANNDID